MVYMMKQNEVKRIVLNVATELSQQGFVLEHEVALQGGWDQAKVDKNLLYATAAKLQDQIAALLVAAKQME